MHEYRCRFCPGVLLKSDATYGRVETICRRCGRYQTVFLGGFQRRDDLDRPRPLDNGRNQTAHLAVDE
jgi:hypothetical protein